MVFEAMQALGKNGVLVLSSITGGDRRVGVPSDRINLEFVLGNKVLVGTVNANREYFERGVQDMALAEAEYSFHLGKPPDGAWLRIRRYMTCQQLIDFIARYSDNDLSPDERDEFEHHPAACTRSAYLKTYEQTILLAKASADEPVPPEVPESLVKAILAAQSNGPS